MGQIITNPDSMKRFANELIECSERLKKEESMLKRDLDALGGTWKDARFQHFDRLITESSKELLRFHSSARDYADYLSAKARAAERFLRP